MQLFMSLHRASFPKLRTVAQRLVEKVRLHGPDLPVDMDLLCAQLSWDIIGEPSCANYHGQLTAAAKHILELPVHVTTPDTVCQHNFVHMLHCIVYVNPCSAYACQQTLYCVHAGIVGFDTDMGATKETGHHASSGTIATVRAGMQEIEQRWGQPYRAELWKYLLPVRQFNTLLSTTHLWTTSIFDSWMSVKLSLDLTHVSDDWLPIC